MDRAFREAFDKIKPKTDNILIDFLTKQADVNVNLIREDLNMKNIKKLKPHVESVILGHSKTYAWRCPDCNRLFKESAYKEEVMCPYCDFDELMTLEEDRIINDFMADYS